MDEKKVKKGAKEELNKEEVSSEREKALTAENENLIKELEEVKKQADDYKDKWMRNVAEFDNYKKRNANQWMEAFNEGVASVILKILPVGDNLDWALTIGLDEKTADGIRSIRRKYDDTLRSMEIEEINPVGQPFDPNVAEAVMQVPASEGEEPDTVKQVFEKGYRKKEKIIRYAKVSVVK